MGAAMTDLSVANHGTIFLLQGLTEAGQEWIDKSLPVDAMTFCGAVVIEHRFIEAIVMGAIADGLTVS